MRCRSSSYTATEVVCTSITLKLPTEKVTSSRSAIAGSFEGFSRQKSSCVGPCEQWCPHQYASCCCSTGRHMWASRCIICCQPGSTALNGGRRTTAASVAAWHLLLLHLQEQIVSAAIACVRVIICTSDGKCRAVKARSVSLGKHNTCKTKVAG